MFETLILFTLAINYKKGFIIIIISIGESYGNNLDRILVRLNTTLNARKIE